MINSEKEQHHQTEENNQYSRSEPSRKFRVGHTSTKASLFYRLKHVELDGTKLRAWTFEMFHVSKMFRKLMLNKNKIKYTHFVATFLQRSRNLFCKRTCPHQSGRNTSQNISSHDVI